MMKNKIILGAVVCAAILVAGGAASADPIQLGILLDGSGSMTIGGAWTDVKAGATNAIASVMPIDSSVELTVVLFGSNTQTIVDTVLIDSQATLDGIVTALNGMSPDFGSTNLSGGLTSLTALIQSSAYYNNGDAEIIYNVATDGFPNSEDNSIAARNAAIAAGVDEIDAEFVNTGGTAGATFLQDEIVWPQPGTTAPPYNPGFVVTVTSDNFEQAFRSKLTFVTGGDVPEPGTIALLGLGLLGLGGAVYRRRRAA